MNRLGHYFQSWDWDNRCHLDKARWWFKRWSSFECQRGLLFLCLIIAFIRCACFLFSPILLAFFFKIIIIINSFPIQSELSSCALDDHKLYHPLLVVLLLLDAKYTEKSLASQAAFVKQLGWSVNGSLEKLRTFLLAKLNVTCLIHFHVICLTDGFETHFMISC